MNKKIKMALISAVTAVVFMPLAASASNLTPVWSPVYHRNGIVGQNLHFYVYAYDPDGDDDDLVYYAMYLPIGAHFDRQRRLFSWTPQKAGKYLAKFRVFDDFYSYADMTVAIKVDNQIPIIDGNNGSIALTAVTEEDNHRSQPQIIIINTQPLRSSSAASSAGISEISPVQKIDKQEKSQQGENEDGDQLVEQLIDSSEEKKLTLAATIGGIFDNILFNRWLLLFAVAVLAVLLGFCVQKKKMLEQELSMKEVSRRKESGKE